MSQVQAFEGTTSPLPPGVIATITGNDGIAVPSDAAHNINIVGDHVALMGYSSYLSGNVGTNTLTMTNPGLGPLWIVTATNSTAIAGRGYLSTKASRLDITLPVAPNIGDAFVVADLSGFTFRILQNAGDSIQLGDLTTTVTTGSITSIKKGDCLMLICWATGPGTSWIAIPQPGNFTVV